MGNLYTGLKIFHFKEKIDSLPRHDSQILPPVHIRIKPTNVCNHNCRYCAYRSDNLQLGQNMNAAQAIAKDKMLAIADDIIAMGIAAVTFSGGGEPLLYPHLADVLHKLIPSPVRFATLTNGARLKGDIAMLFAHHGTWVRVSMDGWDNESYRHYRHTPDGEYSRIIANMEAFKRLGGDCRLGVSLIVDQHNADYVYEFICRMQDIGVDSVKVSPCIVSNDGVENNAYHKPVFWRVKAQLQKAIAERQNEAFEIFDAYHELEEKFDKQYDWCPYCQILPVIGADLNVYTCQDKAYNLDSGCLGSIAATGFKAFWFDGKEKFFSLQPNRACRHHCVANVKNRLVLDYLNADPCHLGFV